MTSSSLALTDLTRSIAAWRLWTFLSWQDIRQRYRGSFLGPWWMVFGIGATAFGMGLLYSAILHVPTNEFLPYLVLGLSIWTFISASLGESCSAFVGQASVIKNTPLPVIMQVFRTISRNVIVLAHNVLVIALVFVIFQKGLGPMGFLALPGFVLLVLNLAWMCWLVAAMSARYRDFIQIVTYLLQFLIFMTPVFWYANMAGPRHYILEFNPFYHLLEIVREPLLGVAPSAHNWIVAVGMLVVGTIVAVLAQMRFQKQIVFWI